MKYAELEADAAYALGELFAVMIRDTYGDDVGHSGAEDGGFAYGAAVVAAARDLFVRMTPRLLPRAVVLKRRRVHGRPFGPPKHCTYTDLRELDLGEVATNE